ncbi:MAG: HEAT repeat domain-containing protein [Deltaproteobacteria bacterium]|nr:HEAT repeat domain-containing protein [Deltaproteobacteria bacterium]
MSEGRQSARTLKRQVLQIIGSDNWEEDGLNKLIQLPPMQVTNALIASFCDTDETIRWRVITATGIVVSRLADDDMESARNILRRLMWSLNSESGGIGWGAPEAIAEIMACHKTLADEFARILVSYAIPDGDNFLDLPELQRGVLWGLGRLSQVRPELVQDIVAAIPFFIASEDATVRGLSAWVAGILTRKDLHGYIEKLLDDDREISLYLDRVLQQIQVKELAREALERIEAG